MDYNKKLGGAHMVTFEQYKEDLEYKKLNENYLILENDDELFNKINKDIEDQKKDKEEDFSDKISNHLKKYKTIYIATASTLALTTLTYFILKSFKESNFKNTDDIKPDINFKPMSDEAIKLQAKYKADNDRLRKDLQNLSDDFKKYDDKTLKDLENMSNNNIDKDLDNSIDKIVNNHKISDGDRKKIKELHDNLVKVRNKRSKNDELYDSVLKARDKSKKMSDIFNKK